MRSTPRLIAVSFVIATGELVGEGEGQYERIEQVFINRAAFGDDQKGLWLRVEGLALHVREADNVVRESDVSRETLG